MNPDHDPLATGVTQVPLYQHAPCKETTEPLADFLVEELGLTATYGSQAGATTEVVILRFLVDNNLRIVKMN